MSVSIIIPIYKDFDTLSVFEKISIRQCLKQLSKYPIYVVGHASLNWHSYKTFFQENEVELSIQLFPDKYFSGIGGYSRLLLSPSFYKRFKDYEYILIHQTDAFVFRDELTSWIIKGYDYIGAPWFDDFSYTNEQATLSGVGNGGFSLRNVQAHLKVLHSFSYLFSPSENWNRRMSVKPTGINWLKQASGFLLDLVIRNNTFWLLNSFNGFEDQFWSLIAARNFKWFRKATVNEAMKFSMEMQPRRVYRMNDHQLPFGCHAWWKYDLGFWRPHMEKYGYTILVKADLKLINDAFKNNKGKQLA